MRTIVAPTLIALSLAVAVAPVSARTDIHTDVDAGKVTILVPYEDLNLSNPQAMAELNNRIRNAVVRLCGDNAPKKAFKRPSQIRCAREADASARAELARVMRGIPAVALNR